MIKCIVVDQDDKGRSAMNGILKGIHHLVLVKSCSSIAQASEILMTDKIDLVFIDLQVPDADGLGFLEEINYERPHLIATGSMREAASKAFEVDAAHFILKPVGREDVLKALTKAFRDNNIQEITGRNSALFIKVNSRLVKIQMKDIILVEALADYVNVYLEGKKYTLHSTMKTIESKLPKRYFMRVHKSYIVQMDAISEIEKETLSIGNRIIPIGNTYKRKLLERLKII